MKKGKDKRRGARGKPCTSQHTPPSRESLGGSRCVPVLVPVRAEGQKQNAQRHSRISERCYISVTPLDGARAAFFKLKPHSTQHRAAFA